MQHAHPFAWRTSLALMGWWPLAGTALLISLIFSLALAVWQESSLTAVRAIDVVLPLAAAIQAAFLLSPEDEPSLELLLTASRPLHWTLLERLVLLLALYGALGFLVTGIGLTFMHAETFGSLFLRWLPPLIWAVGVSLFVVLTTRQGVLGAVVILLLCCGLLWSGDALFSKYRYLLPVHVYLQPGALGVTSEFYLLNRLTVTGLGLIFVGLAARLTSDEERMLGIRTATSSIPELPDLLLSSFSRAYRQLLFRGSS